MSNYEDRFQCVITEKLLLDSWFDSQRRTALYLNSALTLLEKGAAQAQGMVGTGYSTDVAELHELVKQKLLTIQATRPPHSVVDATNDQLEREKNDRLRRAREQLSSSKTIPSSLGRGNETKAWGKLSSVAAALTKDNSATAQPIIKVARKQVYSAHEPFITPKADTGKCPCGHIFYDVTAIGLKCISCGKPLPPF